MNLLLTKIGLMGTTQFVRYVSVNGTIQMNNEPRVMSGKEIKCVIQNTDKLQGMLSMNGEEIIL
jgi:hypothetical protein